MREFLFENECFILKNIYYFMIYVGTWPKRVLSNLFN